MANKIKSFIYTSSLIFYIIFCFFNKANAQTINTHFGKNRVQFHEVFNDWWLYENEHYTIYWYGKERNIAKTAILLTQISYSDIEDILDYKINKKIQLIIYSNISDLRQTNLGIKDDDDQYSGTGITRFYDNKIIVYFDGNHNHLLKQIRKGTATVFLKNMFSNLTFENIYKKLVYADFPKWFTKGITDYLADKWNIDDDEKLRNIFLKNKIDFQKLNKTIPELAGKSFFYFLNEKYGKEKISDIFYLVRISRDIDASFISATDKSREQLFAEWKEYYYNLYSDYKKEKTENPIIKGKFRFTSRNGITSVSMSSGNKYLTYAVNNYGKIELFLYNIKKEKEKKILKLGYINPFQETDYNYPVCAFNDTVTKLAIIYEKKGKLFLRIINLHTLKYVEQVLAPEYNRVYSMDYWDSQNLILNANTDGYPDLYMYKIKLRQSKRLTYDFWDNLDVKTVIYQGKKQIIFSSNRTNINNEIQYLDTIPPIGQYDIFVLDIETKKITRLTNTSDINERKGFLEGEYLYYISDETGIQNIKRKNIKTGDSVFLTNTKGNIRTFFYKNDYIFFNSNMLCDHFLELKKALPEVDANPVMSHLKILKTKNHNEKNQLKNPNAFQDIFEIDSGLFFQAEYIDSAASDLELFNTFSQENTQSTGDDKVKFEKFNSSRAVAARLRFSFTDLVTKIDNEPLFEGMETFNGNQNDFYGQPTGFLVKAGAKDLFEDYFLEAGIRFSSDFREREYFSIFENLKHRIDWQYAFYRKSASSFQFNRPNYIDKYKMTVNMVQVMAKYPFDIYSSFSLLSQFRIDNNTILASDILSLDKASITEQRMSLQAQYIFDNTSKIGINSYIGNRSKAFVRIYNKMNIRLNTPSTFELSKGLMGVVGFDTRQYFRLLGKSVLAFRLSGQTSFGSESNIYFLGGMENWIFGKNSDLVPVPYTDKYAYRIVVANMRGFGYNARNGSSYILSNTELRVPVFQYLFGDYIKKSFFRDFQLTGFFDLGTAWRGFSPFSDDNPSNTRIIEVPPVIKIKLRYYADPLIAGYGFGIRSTLFGYFLKFDYGWGIESGRIQKPLMYFTMGYDF